MLIFRRLRWAFTSPTVTVPNSQVEVARPAYLPTLAPASPPIRMQEVIRYEKEYWRRIAREVGEGFFLMLAIAVLLYGLRWFEQINGVESFWAGLRLDVAPQTGLGLLALLTTIVIGLQVTIRGMPGIDNPTIALGRQLAIENAARAAGFTSFAIFLAVAGYYIRERFATEPALLPGVFVASVLVAGLAADATTASSERFGLALDAVREKSTTSALKPIGARGIWLYQALGVSMSWFNFSQACWPYPSARAYYSPSSGRRRTSSEMLSALARSSLQSA